MPDEGEIADLAVAQFENDISQREVEELRKVLGSKPGRALVWRILGQGGLYAASFSGEQTHGTAYREGKRSIALWLLGEVLTSSSVAYRIMREEAEVQAEADRISREKLRGG